MISERGAMVSGGASGASALPRPSRAGYLLAQWGLSEEHVARGDRPMRAVSGRVVAPGWRPRSRSWWGDGPASPGAFCGLAGYANQEYPIRSSRLPSSEQKEARACAQRVSSSLPSEIITSLLGWGSCSPMAVVTHIGTQPTCTWHMHAVLMRSHLGVLPRSGGSAQPQG